MILNDLVTDLAGRVEETNPLSPVFWSLTGEFYPQLVDGMFEAALITGVVQATNVAVTLAANTTFFDLQNNTAIGIPNGVLAPLRMRAPYPIRRATLKGMDDMVPAWQDQPASTQLIAWGPIGLSKFFIYPQFVAESIVVMDFILSPLNQSRPYTGAETILFQTEFNDSFSQFAASMLRMKEAGAEAEEGATVYDAFLSRMKALSAFQGRLDSLVFTQAYGGRTLPNPRTEV